VLVDGAAKGMKANAESTPVQTEAAKKAKPVPPQAHKKAEAAREMIPLDEAELKDF